MRLPLPPALLPPVATTLRPAKPLVSKLIKGGAAAIIIGPKAVDPVAVAELLSRAIAEKIARGQLGTVSADEKILLVRNRILATARTFLQGPIRSPGTCRDEVDHAFLIASRQLLELW